MGFFGTLKAAATGRPTAEPLDQTRYGVASVPPMSATAIVPASPDPTGPMGPADLASSASASVRQQTRNLADLPAPEVVDPRQDGTTARDLGTGLGAAAGAFASFFAGANRGGGTPIPGPGVDQGEDYQRDAFLRRYGAWVAFGVFALAVVALVKR